MSLPISRKVQIFIWTSLLLFWTYLSYWNHPTIATDAIATGILLAAFAAVIYLNGLVLIPVFWQARRFAAYWSALIFAMGILTIADVFAIQRVYDLMWGSDPARFEFWLNYALDFIAMTVHLGARR